MKIPHIVDGSRHSKRGSTAIEYVLIVALIAVVIVAALQTIWANVHSAAHHTSSTSTAR